LDLRCRTSEGLQQFALDARQCPMTAKVVFDFTHQTTKISRGAACLIQR
jgi:hypothetical protein